MNMRVYLSAGIRSSPIFQPSISNSFPPPRGQRLSGCDSPPRVSDEEDDEGEGREPSARRATRRPKDGKVPAYPSKLSGLVLTISLTYCPFPYVLLCPLSCLNLLPHKIGSTGLFDLPVFTKGIHSSPPSGRPLLTCLGPSNSPLGLFL